MEALSGAAVGPDDLGASLDAARPEAGLEQLARDLRRLLEDGRKALRSGSTVVKVPPSLGGGRLGWSAPASGVRETLHQRLEQLQARGVIDPQDALVLSARFGLYGFPGGASTARRAVGLERQATSNRIRAAEVALATDLASQPLLPVPARTVDEATREEIVGTVLSTLHGPVDGFALRAYVHAAVRRDLLDALVAPHPLGNARDRQRAGRARKEYTAIATDHLDRVRLPWMGRPHPRPSGMSPMVAIRNRLDSGQRLDIETMRALCHDPRPGGWADLGPVRDTLVESLTDGYRTMIELTALGRWLRTGELDQFVGAPLDESSRLRAMLAIGLVIAHRGYGRLAMAYLGGVNQLQAGLDLADEDANDLRFSKGLLVQRAAFDKGPRHLDEARQWYRHLARSAPGTSRTGYSCLAAAHAAVTTEHCAALALGRAQPLSEVIGPLRATMDHHLSAASREDRQRLLIVLMRYAHVSGEGHERQRYEELSQRVDGEVAVTATVEPATAAQVPNSIAPGGQDPIWDEWYCAHATTSSVWNRPRKRPSQTDWRR